MRILSGLVYLGVTAAWALSMLMVEAFRCDESCRMAPLDWHDNPDAWQYAAVAWLGVAGLVVALAAIAMSRRRRWLGLTLLALHGVVFTTNCLVWYLGRTIYGSFIPFALIALAVALCGFVAVGGRINWPGWSRRLRAS